MLLLKLRTRTAIEFRCGGVLVSPDQVRQYILSRSPFSTSRDLVRSGSTMRLSYSDANMSSESLASTSADDLLFIPQEPKKRGGSRSNSVPFGIWSKSSASLQMTGVIQTPVARSITLSHQDLLALSPTPEVADVEAAPAATSGYAAMDEYVLVCGRRARPSPFLVFVSSVRVWNVSPAPPQLLQPPPSLFVSSVPLDDRVARPVAVEAAPASMDDELADTELNDRFQACVESGDIGGIVQISQDFVSTALLIGRLIIDEFNLPTKTIRPIAAQGQLGGRKYLYRGILFSTRGKWERHDTPLTVP